jgi:4-coumarate--CoA ligase
MAQGFGDGLKARLNWRKGDVLAMFAPNSIDIPAVVFGALWAGATLTPANPVYTSGEFAHQLKDSGARAIITHSTLLGTAKQALQLASLPLDVPIVLLDEVLIPSSQLHLYHFSAFIRDNAPSTGPVKVHPKQDVAFLVYSSGTTGKPKGVRLSHYNVTSNISQLQPGDQEMLTWDGSRTCGDIPLPRPDKGDRILACVPFFHIYGLTKVIHNPLYNGTTTIIQARFEIEKWCALVQKHAITFSYIVPPIVLQLCKHPAVPKYDLSSIRMTNSGAAPLTSEVIAACFKRTGIRVKQGYGMSETSPSCFNQRFDNWNLAMGSNGQLLPNLEAMFCAPDDDLGQQQTHNPPTPKPLPIGQTGELWIRGPNVFLGYHNNAAATAAALTRDGWYRSGDLGYVDPQGNLFITDRVKELIKYKGFQVAPAELEGILADHPLVQDCAVVGVPAPEQATELPRAYVVCSDPSKRSEDSAREITHWLASRVAGYKKLRGGVRFVEEIPKNTSGKILRKVLRARAEAELNAGARGGSGRSLRGRL